MGSLIPTRPDSTRPDPIGFEDLLNRPEGRSGRDVAREQPCKNERTLFPRPSFEKPVAVVKGAKGMPLYIHCKVCTHQTDHLQIDHLQIDHVQMDHLHTVPHLQPL